MDKKQIPIYTTEAQKEIWASEAEEMDLSRTEYCRQMIQAGRRDFGIADEDDTTSDHTAISEDIPVEDLEARIRSAINEDEATPFEEIVEHVVTDIERQIDEYLQNAPDIGHSSVKGGYFFTE